MHEGKERVYMYRMWCMREFDSCCVRKLTQNLVKVPIWFDIVDCLIVQNYLVA